MNNRKRVVEIYFVLYLAALVFLLPERDSSFKNGEDVPVIDYQTQYYLYPEKNLLQCKIVLDSNSIRIISLDSINNIYFRGNAENVRYEVIVEDLSIKQALVLQSQTKTMSANFKIIEHPEEKYITFVWKPPLSQLVDKTYSVLVNAIFLPKLSDTSHSISNLASEMTIKTQFTLSVSFERKNEYLTTELVQAQSGEREKKTEIPNSDFKLSKGVFRLIPEYQVINAIAFQSWTNSLTASNINLLKELSGKPKITVIQESSEQDGIAYLSELDENKMVIKGKAPSYGSIKVEVKVKRKDDNQEHTSYFFVNLLPIEQPIYPKVAYPYKTYTIDPKLPLSANKVSAYLKHGDKIVAVSNAGEKFQFTCDIQDTGKVLRLERYIDDKLYGQIYDIRVMDYPEPEIVDIQKSANEVIVITRAYGWVDKQRNEVVEFKVEGNAKYFDQRGHVRDDEEFLSRTQRFVFSPHYNNKPFEFKIVAIDKRGKKSIIKSISN